MGTVEKVYLCEELILSGFYFPHRGSEAQRTTRERQTTTAEKMLTATATAEKQRTANGNGFFTRIFTESFVADVEQM